MNKNLAMFPKHFELAICINVHSYSYILSLTPIVILPAYMVFLKAGNTTGEYCNWLNHQIYNILCIHRSSSYVFYLIAIAKVYQIVGVKSHYYRVIISLIMISVLQLYT